MLTTIFRDNFLEQLFLYNPEISIKK